MLLTMQHVDYMVSMKLLVVRSKRTPEAHVRCTVAAYQSILCKLEKVDFVECKCELPGVSFGISSCP